MKDIMEETPQVLAGPWWEPDPRVRWRPPCLHFPPFAILAAGKELRLSQLQKLFTTMLLPQSEPCAEPRPQR